MPGFAPLYPEDPYEYTDCTALIFEYAITREQLESFVPGPLTIRENKVSLGIYDFGVVSGFGSSHEIGFSIPVSFQGRAMNYTPYMILDNDAPLACGREVWGVPKKLGAVNIDSNGPLVTATASRSGVRLLQATFAPQGSTEDNPLSCSETVYRKTIPAATAGADPVIDRLVVAETSDVTLDFALSGSGTVDLTSSAADPLGSFAPSSDPAGYLVEGDWVLHRTDDAILHRFEESK